MSETIIQLNEAAIKGELKDLVKNSVEETLNALLDHEADELVKHNLLWSYPVIAFPWLLFLFAGIFLYLKEEGLSEKSFFALLAIYVTLFQLPHPWIVEFMLLTVK